MQKHIPALDQSNDMIGAAMEVCAPDDKYQGCTNLMMQSCNRKEVMKK